MTLIPCESSYTFFLHYNRNHRTRSVLLHITWRFFSHHSTYALFVLLFLWGIEYLAIRERCETIDRHRSLSLFHVYKFTKMKTCWQFCLVFLISTFRNRKIEEGGQMPAFEMETGNERFPEANQAQPQFFPFCLYMLLSSFLGFLTRL